MANIPTNRNVRKSFSKSEDNIRMLSLLDIQKQSFNDFLSLKSPYQNKITRDIGNLLEEHFNHQVSSSNGIISKVKYVNHYYGKPYYNLKYCRETSATWLFPIIVRLEYTRVHKDLLISKRPILIHLTDLAKMTKQGTFVINGVEKIILSQLERSSGIYYHKSEDTSNVINSIQLIPEHGPWLQLELTKNHSIQLVINKKVMIPIPIFLYSLGIKKQEIPSTIFNSFSFKVKGTTIKVINENIIGPLNSYLVKKYDDTKLSSETLSFSYKKLRIAKLLKSSMLVVGVHKSGSLLIINSDQHFENIMQEHQLTNLHIIQCGGAEAVIRSIINSIEDTKEITKDKSQIMVSRLINPNKSTNFNYDRSSFEDIFFNSKNYRLSHSLRQTFNSLFNENELNLGLTRGDIIHLVKHIIKIITGKYKPSESNVNSLDSRRFKSVQQIMITIFDSSLHGLIDLGKLGQSVQNMKHDDVGVMGLDTSRIRYNLQNFFNSSSLCQYADQVNILSETTQKRRVTLLGPEGLTQDSATLDNRDVHISEYGKLCPIETPEGHNVGLVNSLSIYTKGNITGYLTTPYQTLNNGILENKIYFFPNQLEYYYSISAFSLRRNLTRYSNKILNTNARYKENFINLPNTKIKLIESSPKQLVSVATSLIPFLEHNDASRALMGANMQRQAIPLMHSSRPLVGTGSERLMAYTTGYTQRNYLESRVIYVDNTYTYTFSSMAYLINITMNVFPKLAKGLLAYRSAKYIRTNQNTCLTYKNQTNPGQYISNNDIVAKAKAIDGEDLSLGKNLLVAYMSFGGYSFEDSIVVSNRLVSENLLTSLHISNFEASEVNNNKEFERFTNRLVGVPHGKLKYLSNDGIIKIGTFVKPGDILIGKLRIKLSSNENATLPELNNVMDLFNPSLDKNYQVNDSSIYMPKQQKGIVSDIRRFKKYSKGIIRQSDNLSSFGEVNDIKKNFINYFIKDVGLRQLKEYNQNAISVFTSPMHDKKINIFIDILNKIKQFDIINDLQQSNILIPIQEHNLPRDQSLSMVSIDVVHKHHIKPGDKITGRYGNKGIISQTLPIEDMPYLEDGTPIDIILNPIGISSRMNMGQIFETQLAWAAVTSYSNKLYYKDNKRKDYNYEDIKQLVYHLHGKSKEHNMISHVGFSSFEKVHSCPMHIKIPNFESSSHIEVDHHFKKSGLSVLGQYNLRDGQTGHSFGRKVSVGYLYTLKLNHFVDNKIHARSIGPYNLISKQPLVGKSQQGGQRFGEMEVWALQAYGAAYTLQELLTVKSDSSSAKESLHDFISKGHTRYANTIPQSFHLLVRELWALGLHINFIQ